MTEGKIAHCEPCGKSTEHNNIGDREFCTSCGGENTKFETHGQNKSMPVEGLTSRDGGDIRIKG